MMVEEQPRELQSGGQMVIFIYAGRYMECRNRVEETYVIDVVPRLRTEQ